MTESDLKKRDNGLINNWYIGCLSSELKEKPLAFVIYDIKLVLFRDENKKAICFKNKCLHRHSELSQGTVNNGKLICPYHGWTYNSEGTVTAVPSEGPTLLTGKRCQKTYQVVERDGVVWVWMGDPPKMDEDKIWKFPHVSGEDAKGWIHYFMVTDFNNEVTNLVENFMDVPHTVFVHKGWFRNRTLKKVPITVQTKNGGVLVTYNQSEDNIGVLIKPLLNPKNDPMIHTDHFIFPNITRVDYSFGENYKYVINSQCTPVSKMKSRVYTYIGYRIPIIGTLFRPFIKYYTRKVIEQDVWIMDVQGRNLDPSVTAQFQSTPADEPHLQIERLRSLGSSGEKKIYEIEKKTEAIIWL